jgi:hypothetical protein
MTLTISARDMAESGRPTGPEGPAVEPVATDEPSCGATVIVVDME